MSTVRLDANTQSQAALALPAQILAARQQQNSVSPQETDIRPPEKVEPAEKARMDMKQGEYVNHDGERRPPPPLKEYARIPTKVTAEILRLQEEALQKADEAHRAEAKAETARTAAAHAEAAAANARTAPTGPSEAPAPEVAPQITQAEAPPQPSPASTGYANDLVAISDTAESRVNLQA